MPGRLPARGEMLTDWIQGKTFYVDRVGKLPNETVVIQDHDGHHHILEHCDRPGPAYERPFNQWELSHLLMVTVACIQSDDVGELESLTTYLNPEQKRQWWESLSVDLRRAIYQMKAPPKAMAA